MLTMFIKTLNFYYEENVHRKWNVWVVKNLFSSDVQFQRGELKYTWWTLMQQCSIGLKWWDFYK